MLHEERPDPIGKIEPKGILWVAGPAGIVMREFVQKSEVQLVAVGVAGLRRLRAKLGPRSSALRADRRGGEIEGIEIQQDLHLDLRDLLELRGI